MSLDHNATHKLRISDKFCFPKYKSLINVCHNKKITNGEHKIHKLCSATQVTRLSHERPVTIGINLV